MHLRVLADALEELHLNRRLSAPWRIVLSFSEGDNTDTTFSLEPSHEATPVPLAALQRDIDAITERLRELVFDEARKLWRTAG